MPRDEHGNVADIVMDPNATVERTNVGRLFEQYINAASRDVHKHICSRFGVKRFEREVIASNALQKLDPQVIANAYQYLLNYYKIVSPIQYSWFVDGTITQSMESYMAEIVNKGVTLFMPSNNPAEPDEAIEQLQKEYPPLYGPVTYVGNSGNTIKTNKNVRIGSVYILLLEKTGDDWSAVSSGRRQHFGALSPVTRVDKYLNPARNQAVRGAGEAEIRIFVSYVGPEFVADLMDRNNSHETHKAMVNGIVKSATPSNIENLVDRAKYPYGGAKPLQLLNHIAQCGGFEFVYAPFVPANQRTGV